MKLKWFKFVSYEEVLKRAKLLPIKILLARYRLNYLGHIQRMKDYETPKQIFYGNLVHGKRKRGGQKLNWWMVIRRDLKETGLVKVIEAVKENMSDKASKRKQNLDNNVKRVFEPRKSIEEKKRIRLVKEKEIFVAENGWKDLAENKREWEKAVEEGTLHMYKNWKSKRVSQSKKRREKRNEKKSSPINVEVPESREEEEGGEMKEEEVVMVMIQEAKIQEANYWSD